MLSRQHFTIAPVSDSLSGGYTGTEGNNTGGVRYHEGIITAIKGKLPNLVSFSSLK